MGYLYHTSSAKAQEFCRMVGKSWVRDRPGTDKKRVWTMYSFFYLYTHSSWGHQLKTSLDQATQASWMEEGDHTHNSSSRAVFSWWVLGEESQFFFFILRVWSLAALYTDDGCWGRRVSFFFKGMVPSSALYRWWMLGKKSQFFKGMVSSMLTMFHWMTLYPCASQTEFSVFPKIIERKRDMKWGGCKSVDGYRVS